MNSTVRQADPASRALRRASRFAAQRVVWAESSLPRLRKCGRTATTPGGAVAVKASGAAADGARVAGYAGLATCGSTWSCPVCSAKIAATRQGELAAAIGAWQRAGHSVTMVTLTMRHRDGQALATLWDAVSYAWGAITSGKAWVEFRLQYAVAGWCRLVEVTHGANGWHVHVHALMFTDANSRYAPADLGPIMFQRWRRGLERKGMAAPIANSGGLHVRTLVGDAAGALSDYFTKSTYEAQPADAGAALAMQMTRGDLKDARHGNRTPFAILRDIVALGDAGDLDLWHEWEQGSSGRRQLTWATGFRSKLVDEPELSDDQVVEADLGGDVVLVLPAQTWRAVVSGGLRAMLLDVAESDDTGANLRAWLGLHGWDWTPGASNASTE